IAGGSERDHEVPPPPQLSEVVPGRRPLGTRPQAVPPGVVGQHQTLGVRGRDAHVARQQLAGRGEPPGAVGAQAARQAATPPAAFRVPVPEWSLRFAHTSLQRACELCGATFTPRLYHCNSCAVQLLLWSTTCPTTASWSSC